MITTGILSAITIKNLDGSFQIDLSGSGGCKYFSNNKLAMEMIANQLKFYNWGKDGDYIGSIGNANTKETDFPNGNPDKPFIGIWNDLDSSLMLAYKLADGTLRPYITLDKYDIQKNAFNFGTININEDIGLGQVLAGIKIHVGMSEFYLEGGRIYTDDTKAHYIGSMMGGEIYFKGSINVNGDINYSGNLNKVTFTG